MNTQSITYSAPGSLMFMGEHAVLNNQPAIACAINNRLTTTITPNCSQTINIRSSLGNLSFPIDNIRIDEKLSFITYICKAYQPLLHCGIDIIIESDIATTYGLSSSAATTLSTIACIRHYLGLEINQHTLIKESRRIIRSIQKHASATDVAACYSGGTIFFDPTTLHTTNLPNPELGIIYVGYKTTTSEVISLVKRKQHQQPHIYNNIWLQAGDLTKQAKQYILSDNKTKLAKTMIMYQNIMLKIGVSDSTLNKIIAITTSDNNIHAAKISGSGLGDCIITLGKITTSTMDTIQSYFPHAIQLHTPLTSQGLRHEKE